jgi:hypothetical protein
MKLRRSVTCCELCGIEFYKSHHRWEVHHWTYRNLPKEKPDDLSVLCSACHEDAHRIMDVRETDPFHTLGKELIRNVVVPVSLTFSSRAGRLLGYANGSMYYTSVCIDGVEFSLVVHEKIMACGDGFPA